MMNLIEDINSGTGPEAFGAETPMTSQENFVNGVYSSVDEATACELDRLRSEEGIVPTCKKGCCDCCRYHILTTIVEAHTLAQFLKRELSADQINALRLRTEQWHEWDNYRPVSYPSANINELRERSNYNHCCPMLVNGLCIAYPVRPVVCRTHFVWSQGQRCCATNGAKSAEDAPVPLWSVVTATNSFSLAIRDHIEDAGLDFTRSIRLLPHWLVIEMGW